MGQRSRHEVDVEVFFDFTCEFSYRARHWLEGMEGMEGMEVIRRPLSLLEVTATTTAVRCSPGPSSRTTCRSWRWRPSGRCRWHRRGDRRARPAGGRGGRWHDRPPSRLCAVGGSDRCGFDADEVGEGVDRVDHEVGFAHEQHVRRYRRRHRGRTAAGFRG